MRRGLRLARMRQHHFGLREEGSVALEFALLFPLMVLVCIGIAELLALAVVQQRISAAADAGAELIRLGRHGSAADVETTVEATLGDAREDVNVTVACAEDDALHMQIAASGDDAGSQAGDDGGSGGLARISVRYEPPSLGGRLLGDGFALVAERYAADPSGAICR